MRDPLGRPPAPAPGAGGARDAAARRAAGRDGRGHRWRGLPAPAGLGAAAGGALAVAAHLDRRDAGLPGPRAAARLAAGPASTFRGRRSLRALVTVPLVLPPVVAGVALLTAFGRTGRHRRTAARADRLRVPVHDLGRRAGPRVRLDAVRGDRDRGLVPLGRPGVRRRGGTLGATRWTTFRRVTVPLALPGILAGRARLGPLARRVRRDHHVQRQLPRRHADHAAR